MEVYREIILTLFEGHYHYGVAALANSLVKSEFKGLFLVGYRGNLPVWINQLKKVDENSFQLSENIVIRFVKLEISMHFGYYKPTFITDSLAAYPTVEKAYYFDPDIVVSAPWDFFSKWPDFGVALCIDCSFPYVPKNHPWRKDWAALANTSSYGNIDFYVNSGFIGIHRKDTVLLDTWNKLTDDYQKGGGRLDTFQKQAFRSFKGDQDLLNAAITVTNDLEYSIVGSEGMGFTIPAYLMTHAVYDIKPWRKNFLKMVFVRGHKPTVGDADFFRHIKYPIDVFGNGAFLKKLNFRIATILGRIIG